MVPRRRNVGGVPDTFQLVPTSRALSVQGERWRTGSPTTPRVCAAWRDAGAEAPEDRVQD